MYCMTPPTVSPMPGYREPANGGEYPNQQRKDILCAVAYGKNGPKTARKQAGTACTIDFLRKMMIIPTRRASYVERVGGAEHPEIDKRPLTITNFPLNWPHLSQVMVHTHEKRRNMNRADAFTLLNEYVKDPGLIRHMLAVEIALRAYARKHGANEDTWGIIGL